MKEYLVIYERAGDGGWGAHSPGAEHVFAVGRTPDEVERRMREAEGQSIPAPHTDAGVVAA